MKNLNEVLNNYLEAKRHLWNTYFLGTVKSLRDSSPLDEYEDIDRLLFKALVLRRINKDYPADKDFIFGEKPFPFLKALPSNVTNTIEILVSESKTGNRQWQPFSLILSKDVEFTFIEFFEWDRYAHVTYPFSRLRVEKCNKYPEIIGFDAIVQNKYINFFLQDNSGDKGK